MDFLLEIPVWTALIVSAPFAASSTLELSPPINEPIMAELRPRLMVRGEASAGLFHALTS